MTKLFKNIFLFSRNYNIVRYAHKYFGIPMDDLEDKSKASSSITKEYRFIYPEFLPNNSDWTRRNKLAEMLERQDMIKRRQKLMIPEFYVGTIISVTVADPYAPDQLNHFMGICILRGEHGLRHNFLLRNVVNNMGDNLYDMIYNYSFYVLIWLNNIGVEIMYEMYNPVIQSINVIKLEKRLDDHLLYLRDALPEYSTFDFNMPPVFHSSSDPIPINPIKVKLNPRPWTERWERYELQGIEDPTPELLPHQKRMAKNLVTPWEKYDVMKAYRANIPKEEQDEIFREIKEREDTLLTRKTRRKVGNKF